MRARFDPVGLQQVCRHRARIWTGPLHMTTPTEPAVGNTPKGRLLVLDDDAAIGQLLVFVAQRAGYEARLCAQAADFLQAVHDWLPTHLAIDLSMPDMPGLEVMRQVAAQGSQAWVIISSGAGAAEIESALQHARALGLRTAGALPKPFSLHSMRELLAQTTDEDVSRRT